MTYFLTSSPCVEGEVRLNPENGFVDRLRDALPDACAGVFVCADPDGAAMTDRFAGEMYDAFTEAGIEFSSYEVLDRRTQPRAAELIAGAQLLILAGGHVPTQNRFFEDVDLRALLQGFDGAVVGISAGTMNSADTVYAHPELDGEAADPDYRRFLPGLGITKRMVLPHYQKIAGGVLDGQRLVEDIAYPDSFGNEFFALVDGSYIYGKDGREQLLGEAYRIQDGRMEQIGEVGDCLELP